MRKVFWANPDLGRVEVIGCHWYTIWDAHGNYTAKCAGHEQSHGVMFDRTVQVQSDEAAHSLWRNKNRGQHASVELPF